MSFGLVVKIENFNSGRRGKILRRTKCEARSGFPYKIVNLHIHIIFIQTPSF